MQMSSKRLQSERGEVDFDLCFISKSERHRARGRRRTDTALKSSGLSLATLRMRINYTLMAKDPKQLIYGN